MACLAMFIPSWNGLLPRTFLSCSPSESGTRREGGFDAGLRPVALTGGRESLLGGGASLRFEEAGGGALLSYSTDVLRGTGAGRDEDEDAQEPLWSEGALMSVVAAWMNAVAMFTEVSLTLHFSGLGGEVMILGPPGREVRSVLVSRCLRRANRTSAGSFSFWSTSCSCACGLVLSREGDVGLGGDREPKAGALWVAWRSMSRQQRKKKGAG